MQVGSLVRHIEYEYIGILTERGLFFGDNWWIHWNDGSRDWYSECELEVICK